jgi:hypothetical protein
VNEQKRRTDLSLGASEHARMRLLSMCRKCEELDRKIGHLRRMIERLADPQTIAAANALIEKMDAQKATLHPEPQGK